MAVVVFLLAWLAQSPEAQLERFPCAMAPVGGWACPGIRVLLAACGRAGSAGAVEQLLLPWEGKCCSHHWIISFCGHK